MATTVYIDIWAGLYLVCVYLVWGYQRLDAN